MAKRLISMIYYNQCNKYAYIRKRLINSMLEKSEWLHGFNSVMITLQILGYLYKAKRQYWIKARHTGVWTVIQAQSKMLNNTTVIIYL